MNWGEIMVMLDRNGGIIIIIIIIIWKDRALAVWLFGCLAAGRSLDTRGDAGDSGWRSLR